MTPLRRVAAIVLTLAAAALATTAQNDAHASSPLSRAGAGTPHTRLHLHVTGCDRCSITLQQAVEGRLARLDLEAAARSAPTTSRRSDDDDRPHARPVVRDPRAVGGQHRCRAEHGHPLPRPAGRRRRHARARPGTAVAPRAAGPARRSTPRASTSASRGWRPGRWTASRTQIPLAYATHSMSSWRPMVRPSRARSATRTRSGAPSRDSGASLVSPSATCGALVQFLVIRPSVVTVNGSVSEPT